jgi:hypothetical protein
MTGDELQSLRLAAGKAQKEACAMFDYGVRQWQNFESGAAEIQALLERPSRRSGAVIWIEFS